MRLLLLLGLGWLLPAQAGLPETIIRIKPSIVAIATYQKLRSPALQIRGSGFVVGDGQTVVTNAHVLPDTLAEDERLIVVVPGSPPRSLEAALQVRNRDHDLALLRTASALPSLRLAAPELLREGQSVLFTGFPIGGALGAVPVSHRGMVSAITPIALPGGTAGQVNSAAIRQLRSGSFMVYQLDATAYPGNSGSPLLDPESGEVTGIINMVYVKSSKESALSQPSGITFAIPVRHLADLLAAPR